MRIKLLYIGNKLSKHGNTATSIETLGQFLEEENFVLYYASSKKNKILRLLDMVFSTLRYSRKVDYVLIDVYSTQNFWYAIIISQLCRLLNLKYISKLHGGNLPNRYLKNPKLCNLIFNHSYKTIAPSSYLFDFFEKTGYKNLIYIPNTINLDNYQFYNRPTKEPKLLWVRSFSSIYNPKMAIRVFSEIKKEYPNAQLCMVGPDKENMMQDCLAYSEKLNVSVEFTGKLSKDQWIKLSKEYAIFINTTHFDNTPVSVIEAMALGLPVVSTNVGGIPFLLTDNENALLINDNDTDGMVRAIKRLIGDDNLRNRIVTNARLVVADFDWNIVKQKWLEILK